MIRSNTAYVPAILLALLGGSGLLFLCALSSGGERSAALGTPSPPAVERPRRADVAPARAVHVARTGPAESAASGSLEDARGRRAPALPRSPAIEREFHALFLAEARAAPGSLEGRARAVLDGPGPRCEKVALLRALEDHGSPETAAWLEHAVRALPEDADAHAVSLPTFALERLAGLAAGDAAGRAALARIAFDRTAGRADLRRRAAAHLAAASAGGELLTLQAELAREPDELLVAGALAALEERAGDPCVESVLAFFGRVVRHAPADG